MKLRNANGGFISPASGRRRRVGAAEEEQWESPEKPTTAGSRKVNHKGEINDKKENGGFSSRVGRGCRAQRYPRGRHGRLIVRRQ